MSFIRECRNKVIDGLQITKEDALKLYYEDLEELTCTANELREHFCGNAFDICTIINAKSGKCSENCKYCAQSAHYKTLCDEYPLVSKETLLDDAKHNAEQGVLRYSIVTSGRNISDDEVDKVCEAISEIHKNVNIKVCGSFGLLNEKQFKKLYDAGLTRIHNNLETSKEYFPKMCTTHTFEDKLKSISAAKSAGLEVCSGGIFGIGESVEDRISLAFSLKEIGVKSIPINLLNPIKGTPCENNAVLTEEELRRIVATYRFIMPSAFVRLAGGRGLLDDKGKKVFYSGANAAISGDMLTTAGVTTKTDLAMLDELGFKVQL